MEVEDPPDDEDQKSHGPIDINRMRVSLRSLALLDADLYLGLQATNLAIVDGFITELEMDVQQKRMDEDPGHLPVAALVSAQSQMWIFAAYELLRTWRQRAKDAIDLKEKGGLEARITELESNLGFRHVSRQMRADQLRKVRDDPNIIRRLKDDLKRIHMTFRQIEHLRMALAKHEVKGRRKSPAYSPGSGYPDHETGSLRYEIEIDGHAFGIVSRRDIADSLRALDGLAVPSAEEIAAFDRMMQGPPPVR